MPSFILIRPTGWPQYTNVTDTETGQDKLVRGREPFYKLSAINDFTSAYFYLQFTLVHFGARKCVTCFVIQVEHFFPLPS